MSDTKLKPPPGSNEAIQQGCKCPVIENNRGKGYMGLEGVYVYSGGCDLHIAEAIETNKRLDHEDHEDKDRINV